LGCALDHAGMRVWDVESGKRVAALEGQAAALDVKGSPDGLRTARVGQDNSIEIRQQGKVLHTLSGHKLSVTALAFSPDGRRLLSSAADATVRTWDVERGKEDHLFSLPGPGGATRIAFSPDGRRAAVAAGSTVTVLNV